MESVTPPVSNTSRPTYSCIRCAERKVKCDRKKPCSACVKHAGDCAYNLSQPPRQKRKRVKDKILADKLRHYEALLQERGIDIDKIPDTPEPKPNQSMSNVPILVRGQGHFKFVDNSLWMSAVEEFYDPEDASEDFSSDVSDQETSEDDFDFVLAGDTRSRTRPCHPPPEHIYQLWLVFVENVEPLTKIVHVLTLKPAIQKAMNDIKSIPRGFEALMFAIYGAAVMSLTDGECKQRFFEPQKVLLSRYISATKTALSRAKFMGTSSLVVLQALILHLLAVRDIYEPRVVWSLTGVAVRIAEGMGLERDGVALGLPPFETEMRRRVWWFLKSHDFRTAELCGLSKFRDLDVGVNHTKWPTNVNDDQLYVGMPSIAVESNALTDMSFVAMKYDLVNFAAGSVKKFRKEGTNCSQWELGVLGNNKMEIEEALKEMEEFLETKYLRYCDPSQPLHLMTLLVGQLALNFIRFLAHHPRRWASIDQMPASERQIAWDVSIKLLEQHNMVQTNPNFKQFAWQATYFHQWHAFIHILDTLRADPLITNAEKAWRLIGSIYESSPDMILDMKKPIHVAVDNLCLKAYSDRETALKNRNIQPPPTPNFILLLRQHYETTMAKRQERSAKSNSTEDSASRSHNSDGEKGTVGVGVTDLSQNLISTNLQQSTMPMLSGPNSSQTIGTADYDMFWVMNGFDDSIQNNIDGGVNMDPESMPAQGYGAADDPTQIITWDQWDAYLADSNVIRPLSQHGI